MKYFLDTEFIERGPQYPIELISIGIVAEDGREYYAISNSFDPSHASQWVLDNVISKLESNEDFPRKSRAEIGHDIFNFIAEEPGLTAMPKPEIWAYYADYDWVVFCQIFGAMIDLPKGWPMYCRDLKQLADSLGNPKLPEQGKGEHNALADARWNKTAYEFLAKHKNEKTAGVGMIWDERVRQLLVEGWTPEHDDEHCEGEMVSAAMSYAWEATGPINSRTTTREDREIIEALWPWDGVWWKPSSDPIRNLVKAGALIAAEIDRLRRKASNESAS